MAGVLRCILLYLAPTDLAEVLANAWSYPAIIMFFFVFFCVHTCQCELVYTLTHAWQAGALMLDLIRLLPERTQVSFLFFFFWRALPLVLRCQRSCARTKKTYRGRHVDIQAYRHIEEGIYKTYRHNTRLWACSRPWWIQGLAVPCHALTSCARTHKPFAHLIRANS